jgi:hypothetical protein
MGTDHLTRLSAGLDRQGADPEIQQLPARDMPVRTGRQSGDRFAVERALL